MNLSRNRITAARWVVMVALLTGVAAHAKLWREDCGACEWKEISTGPPPVYELVTPCSFVTCRCPVPSRKDQRPPARTTTGCLKYVPPEDMFAEKTVEADDTLVEDEFAFFAPTNNYQDGNNVTQNYFAFTDRGPVDPVVRKTGAFSLETSAAISISYKIEAENDPGTVTPPPLPTSGDLVIWFSSPTFQDNKWQWIHRPMKTDGVEYVLHRRVDPNGGDPKWYKLTIQCLLLPIQP